MVFLFCNIFGGFIGILFLFSQYFVLKVGLSLCFHDYVLIEKFEFSFLVLVHCAIENLIVVWIHVLIISLLWWWIWFYCFLRWGTYLYMSLFPSLRLSLLPSVRPSTFWSEGGGRVKNKNYILYVSYLRNGTSFEHNFSGC